MRYLISGDIPRKYGQTYGTFTYLHFRILKFPLNISYNMPKVRGYREWHEQPPYSSLRIRQLGHRWLLVDLLSMVASQWKETIWQWGKNTFLIHYVHLDPLIYIYIHLNLCWFLFISTYKWGQYIFHFIIYIVNSFIVSCYKWKLSIAKLDYLPHSTRAPCDNSCTLWTWLRAPNGEALELLNKKENNTRKLWFVVDITIVNGDLQTNPLQW